LVVGGKAISIRSNIKRQIEDSRQNFIERAKKKRKELIRIRKLVGLKMIHALPNILFWVVHKKLNFYDQVFSTKWLR